VAAALSDSYGQVIVEDKPGASGLIAAGAVAEAIPNGRTVLLGSNSTLVNNLAMMSTLPYDAKSFVPVAFVGYQPQVILIRGDLPYKSLADLVADAKAHPGKLNRGSAGVGSITNLAAEVFLRKAGVDITHIPYPGDAPSITAMLAGTIDVHVTAISVALPYLDSGKIRVLAVMDNARLASIPDVPTLKESGYDLEVSSWFCLVAPAKTPKDVVERLNKAMTQALQRPETASKLRAVGIEPKVSTPEQLGEHIDAERVRWFPIIKELGLKMN
jgi:tripartite-type tricarboxylate transporter receptor subunit TctC